jgi:hypothetical protein
VIGNSVALLFVGLRLEMLIGRAWFAAIFVFSALAGEAGSLLGNPHMMTTVGASGAITGLIGAIFVVSFQVADPAVQRKMMRTATRFGAPALLPLVFGASGHVDYAAHSAGAVGGALAGMVMSALWSADHPFPYFRREVAAASMVALGVSVVACGFAGAHYGAYAEKAARLAPSFEIAASDDANISELASRYPDDPRVQVAEAVALLKKRNWPGAEAKLRKALATASTDSAGQPIVDLTRTLLAAVIEQEGRRNEAKAMAADLCRTNDQLIADTRRILEKAKLCD